MLKCDTFLKVPWVVPWLLSSTEAFRGSFLLQKILLNWINGKKYDTEGSVTRFGEIPPLWQLFKSLWQYISGLFGFGQSFQIPLAQFVCLWTNFNCFKWPNIENTIWSSGHTGHTGSKNVTLFYFKCEMCTKGRKPF